MPFYFYLVTIAASAVGFTIAFYIYKHKKTEAKMICPLDSNCESVVHSPYSKFIGIPLEQWGMLYYGVILFAYFAFLFEPTLARVDVLMFIGFLSIYAFVFSLYLTYVQMAKLKEWCTWCLTSAVASAIIFLALIGNSLTGL